MADQQGLTNLMVQKDLEESGIPVVLDGKSFDFHGLRGQFVTRLALAGVGLAKAPKLMRHSDPRLTSSVYTHLSMEDLGKEVDKLG